MLLMKRLFVILVVGWSGATSGAAFGKDQSVDAALSEARTALHQSDYATAISLLENMDGQTGRWEVPFWLGTAYLLNGQLDHAALTLDDALALETDIADIWVQRAVVAQELLRPEVALQLLEVAAQVDGSFALTYLNAALAYESLGDAENARGAYGRFLKLSAEAGGSNRMRRLRRDVINQIANSGRSE